MKYRCTCVKGNKIIKKNLDEIDSLESGDDGDISDMITEWRDDEQELMSLMDQDNYNEGDYVMVKFTRKQRVSYYAGEIKEIDTESEEAQTMFLRWGDLHKGFALTFYWPKESYQNRQGMEEPVERHRSSHSPVTYLRRTFYMSILVYYAVC